MPNDSAITVPLPADQQNLEPPRVLTPGMQVILSKLMKASAPLEQLIPSDSTAQSLWESLEACATGTLELERRTLKLRPIIGRILEVFHSKPSLYKELGYENWSLFLKNGVYEYLKLHRTAGYQALYAAREWPDLSPDRYAAIGPKKMEILKQVTNGKSSNAPQWLDAAQSKTVTQLQRYVEEGGFAERGATAGATFVVSTNQARLKRFREFFGDGRVHSVVGKSQPDEILEALINECHGEWITKFLERGNK